MYSKGTWNKWILIPLWIVHIGFELTFVGILAFMMMEVSGTLGYVPTYAEGFFLTARVMK